jgi:hypothetical protein
MSQKVEKILTEMNSKLDLLILVTSLNGKSKDEQKKILKNYNGSLSKRELERVTGIDRHEF